MAYLDKSQIKTIALVAGEHSGDTYGAKLIAKLKSAFPNANYIGIGGHKMQEQGLQSFVSMDKLSVIGIVNIIKKLPELINLKNKLVAYLLGKKIDLYIGIDAPDFNLVVAKKIKKISNKLQLNIKTVQYISPTVWAWRPKRIFTVAKATDLVLCIFPFEEQIYKDNNIAACFVGHPLADTYVNCDREVKIRNSDLIGDYIKTFSYIETPGSGPGCTRVVRTLANTNVNLNNKTLIGLFPGSRSGEIRSLALIFIKTAIWLLKQNKEVYFIVPLVSNKIALEWQKIYDNLDDDDFLLLNKSITSINLEHQSHNITSKTIMQASEVILCASGTTTLEAFLLGVPMVVAYKVSKLNELIFRWLIKVNYIAMPNILSDKLFTTNIVPEFLQSNVTVDNLGNSILKQVAKHNVDNKWLAIQKYLKTENKISHEQAVLKAITDLL